MAIETIVRIVISALGFMNGQMAYILGTALIGLAVWTIAAVIALLVIAGPWLTFPGIPWSALLLTAPILFSVWLITHSYSFVTASIKKLIP